MKIKEKLLAFQDYGFSAGNDFLQAFVSNTLTAEDESKPDELKSTIIDGLLTKVAKEEHMDLVEAIEKLNEPMTLADFLGWEEGVVYDLGPSNGGLLRIKDGRLQRRIWRYMWTDATITLTPEEINRYRKATIYVPKYRLESEFNGKNGVQYFSCNEDEKEYFFASRLENEKLQEFTKEKAEELIERFKLKDIVSIVEVE